MRVFSWFANSVSVFLHSLTIFEFSCLMICFASGAGFSLPVEISLLRSIGL